MSKDLAAATGREGDRFIRPRMARVSVAAAYGGLSRSGLYREAAAGHIYLVKHRRTTLVDMDSVDQFLASLPPAKIGSNMR